MYIRAPLVLVGARGLPDKSHKASKAWPCLHHTPLRACTKARVLPAGLGCKSTRQRFRRIAWSLRNQLVANSGVNWPGFGRVSYSVIRGRPQPCTCIAKVVLVYVHSFAHFISESYYLKQGDTILAQRHAGEEDPTQTSSLRLSVLVTAVFHSQCSKIITNILQLATNLNSAWDCLR